MEESSSQRASKDEKSIILSSSSIPPPEQTDNNKEETGKREDYSWRTPIYPLDSSHTNSKASCAEISSSSTNSENVRVPVNGLYGFIFGKKKHGEEFEANKPDGKKGDNKKGDNNQLPHCGCTFKASFTLARTNNGAIRLGQIDADASILLPLSSPTSNKKVITSTRVAKVFYIPRETKVSIQRNSFCDEDNHQTEWVWGLAIQKKFHSYSSTSCSPTEKKAKHDNDHLLHKGEVHFYTDQSAKKPLVCTECVRKFPTCQAVRNHYATIHAPKLGEDCGTRIGDDYEDIVGQKIFRTPLVSVYEDDDLAVIVKPQGLPVQGERFTIASSDLLMPYKSKLGRSQDLSKPRIAHRIDKETGGLLVIAKTFVAERNIKKSFEDRLCKKRYRAIVFGKWNQNEHPYSKLDDDEENKAYSGMGIINTPLSGKQSVTRYQIVECTPCDHELANGFITTVDLYPFTGRQHQLRKHLKLIGHPIWGDMRYAQYSVEEKAAIKANAFHLHSKMCLWALEITFPHPCENRMINAQINEPAWYQYLRKSASTREEME